MVSAKSQRQKEEMSKKGNERRFLYYPGNIDSITQKNVHASVDYRQDVPLQIEKSVLCQMLGFRLPRLRLVASSFIGEINFTNKGRGVKGNCLPNPHELQFLYTCAIVIFVHGNV